MKNSIIALVVIVSLGLTSCGKGVKTSKIDANNLEQAQKRDIEISEGAPVAKFDQVVFDFGTVNEGDIVETVFKLTNTGKGDLVITNASSSCGCTVPTWPKGKPVKAGETVEIGVRFNTSHKPNKQTKAVTLITNTEKGSEIVKVKGFVTPKAKTPTLTK